MNTQNSLEAYEEKQAEIKKLLAQIAVGLEQHDLNASGKGGHNWGHVGDLTSIAATLTDLRDRLHGTGEYQTFDRKGRKIKVMVPLTE